jgi:putative membrane protein
MLKAAFLPVSFTVLALAGCVGDPKFPAGNDHDGNTSQRATNRPTAMLTTDEMMEGDLLQPREDEVTDADAYPEIGTDYEPVRTAAVVRMPDTSTAMTNSLTYPTTAYSATTYPTQITLPVARTATSDSRFTQEAMSGSATEIALARIAVTRTQSPEVRQFAQQMLTDHRQIATNLDDFALQRGYVVNWSVSSEQQATINRLQSIDQASFDNAYMQEMVRAHENTVALLRAQSNGGTATASLARETLPTAEHHLQMARELDARV